MLAEILRKLENPEKPLLGPNVKILKFWGLLLPENVFKKYLYFSMHTVVAIFIATEYVDMWFVKSDINLFLNNLKITILATVSVCKLASFLYWQQHWNNIIEYVTRADLYQRITNDEIKINMITTSTNYCRKITYIYWSLMNATIIILIIQPIFKYSSSEVYRENIKNGTDSYPHILSSWVPFDKNTIPGYFATAIFHIYISIYGSGWIISFDTNAIVIMVFFRIELELLRIESADIFGREQSPVSEDDALNRLKHCHRRHVELIKFARLFNSCLSPIMLLFMFVCSVMLCITGYQITVETNSLQRLLTTEYLVFGVAQLFVYCWHSNDVLYASQDLMLSPYESTWWRCSVKSRKNLFILVAQFNKTVVFTAGPFTDLTVPTFINIIKGAYSYYTLLTQSQIK